MESERIVLFILCFFSTSGLISICLKDAVDGFDPIQKHYVLCLCLFAMHWLDTVLQCQHGEWYAYLCVCVDIILYSSISRFDCLGVAKRWMVLVSIPDVKRKKTNPTTIEIEDGSSYIPDTHIQYSLSSTSSSCVHLCFFFSCVRAYSCAYTLPIPSPIAYILFREVILPQSVR